MLGAMACMAMRVSGVCSTVTKPCAAISPGSRLRARFRRCRSRTCSSSRSFSTGRATIIPSGFDAREVGDRLLHGGARVLEILQLAGEVLVVGREIEVAVA